MVHVQRTVLSFLTLLVFWLVGRAFAVFWGDITPLFSLQPFIIQNLILLGLGALYFSTLFFGRTGFLFFFGLGALTDPLVTYQTLGLNVAAGIVLAAFGSLGALLGHLIADDLQDKEKLDLLQPTLTGAIIVSVLLAVGVGLFSGQIHQLNGHAIDVLRDFRDGRISLFETLAQLAQVDWALINTPPNDDAYWPYSPPQ